MNIKVTNLRFEVERLEEEKRRGNSYLPGDTFGRKMVPPYQNADGDKETFTNCGKKKENQVGSFISTGNRPERELDPIRTSMIRMRISRPHARHDFTVQKGGKMEVVKANNSKKPIVPFLLHGV